MTLRQFYDDFIERYGTEWKVVFPLLIESNSDIREYMSVYWKKVYNDVMAYDSDKWGLFETMTAFDDVMNHMRIDQNGKTVFISD